MEVKGRHIVVTGGASGIGRAMVERFAAEGARAVVVADLDGDGAKAVAAGIGAMAVETDVSRESDITALVSQAIEANGPIDLMCSNAGMPGWPGGGPEVVDETWQRLWEVNVMSNVWAARAVLPAMLERGEGYLLNTASAAGLLTNLGNLAYSVSKHAAVALSEWLSITYGNRGIKVSCLCPLAVRTPMLEAALDRVPGAPVVAGDSPLEPDDVATAVVDGLRDERFLILPHPEVATFLARKGSEPDRWLATMRRIQHQIDMEMSA